MVGNQSKTVVRVWDVTRDNALNIVPLNVPHKPSPDDLILVGDEYVVPPLVQAAPFGALTSEVIAVTGFLAKNDAFDGVLCVPGSETAWVQVSAQEIVSFQVFDTGELSVGGETGAAFVEALDDAMSSPALVPQRRAGLRAALQLGQMTAEEAAERLTGLVIGAGLAGSRPYWLGQRVCVLSDQENEPFFIALEHVGAFPERASLTQSTNDGRLYLASFDGNS